ncbi:ABC transporter permease [Rubellimicrobium arenae]|uniref:ABC transporter permease n=1 Tax=Rubellimicrobium arenae TaxID=2817372 RepID=UPI001B301892|nr:ABC transporter permease [Rubellimicrobium arenae]
MSPTSGRLNLLLSHEAMLAILLAVTLLILSLLSDSFFSTANLLNQVRLTAEIGLITLAMTLVIITGGIDLSVGSIAGLSAIMLGLLWQKAGLPLPLAAVTSLGIAVLAGLGNGVIITRFRVPPLIATLATMAFYRGLAEGFSQSRSVRGYPEGFYILGQGEVLGLPTQVWILIVAAVLVGTALSATAFGRTVFAIGANETAARFSSLPVDRVKLIVYGLSGFMSGLSGLLLVSRVTTTRSDMGMGWELDAITAVVLGGASIFGGRGTVLGSVLALALIQCLKSGLSLAGVKADGTIVLIGLFLIGAVLLGNLMDRIAAR